MSDFKTVLVRDSVIGDITSDIDFAVKSGASQTTYQRFPSTSSSNSAVIFNVQVPSENVVIGRDILINTGLSFTLNVGSATEAQYQVPAGDSAFSYGLTDSLQAFPFNSLLTTATAQINNTTCSVNLQDVLPSLLRLNDSRELYRFNSTTPSLPDQAYGDFADAVLTNNNPLASYNTASYDIDQVPRGAFPVSVTIQHFVGGVLIDTSPISTSPTDTWVITVQTVVSEPLFLSPFIFGNPEFNCQGLLGINNMTFTLNVDATCKRLFSSANKYIRSIALGTPTNPNGFQSTATVGIIAQPSAPALLLKFLSTQPSDLVQTKNIVPYMDYPRYLTNSANSPTLTPAGSANQSATLTSSNLQINQIPDLFLINVRIPMSQQSYQNPSSFLTINNISINLNNQSGLLSSASQYDLWRLSVKNGSTQSWEEFSGQALVNDNTTGTGVIIPTTGSLLVLNPAYDLSLPDYITCGSLGNYNFQFQCNATNQYGVSIQPEIIVICVNSGIFSTQQGVSAVYTGILTKEMVLDAKTSQQASAFKSMEIKRMTGGQMLNSPLTAMKAFRRIRGMLPAPMKAMLGGESSGGKSRLSKMC
nr:MAG: putative major capsid protein [Lake Baikal virophage 8]